MPGQKISSLTPVSDLQAADQFPLARSGSTYKITGDKFASKAQLDSLSATTTGSFALKTDLASLSSTSSTALTGLSSTVDVRIASLSSTVDSRLTALSAAVDQDVASLSSTVDNKFIIKPATASAQQVLTYNGSTATWVASAAPGSGTGGAVTATNTAKAWVNFDGTAAIGTLSIIGKSFNVSSVTKTAVGKFTIAFPVGVFSDANYSVLGTCQDMLRSTDFAAGNANTAYGSTRTTTSCLVTTSDDGGGGGSVFRDSALVNFVFFGN